MPEFDWGFGSSKKDKKKKSRTAFGLTPLDLPEEQPLFFGSQPQPDPEGDDSVYDLLRLKFPIPSREHGSEFVTVNVGGDKKSLPKHIFNIHKKLLICASEYFSKSVQENFAEGKTNYIDLKWACPAAFEVLYQALYSGQVLHADFYTHGHNHKQSHKHNQNGENESDTNIPQDVLWLRTFNLAHAIMFQELLSVAYERFRELFNSQRRQVPSPLFIQELFSNDDDDEGDHDQPTTATTTTTASTHLHDFVVQHTAYWIKNDGQVDSQEWKKTLNQNNRFGTAVACRLTELHSDPYEGSKEHPIKDDAFSHEKFFARVYDREEIPPASDCPAEEAEKEEVYSE